MALRVFLKLIRCSTARFGQKSKCIFLYTTNVARLHAAKALETSLRHHTLLQLWPGLCILLCAPLGSAVMLDDGRSTGSHAYPCNQACYDIRDLSKADLDKSRNTESPIARDLSVVCLSTLSQKANHGILRAA
eukprot:6213743-Pleurochrysis_carterae.AAC.1